MRFRRRLLILYGLFCVALGIVWLRAGQMQFLDGDAWAEAARKMREHEEPLEAQRGAIIGADGTIVAEDAHGYELVVVPYDWLRRGRARCEDCRAVAFERGLRAVERDDKPKTLYIPRTCPCARYARRGAAAAPGGESYPRLGGDEGRMVRLPDGDVGALERGLGLEQGELARRAQARIDEVERLIVLYEQSQREKPDTAAFLDTRVEQRRQDLLHRPFVIEPRVPDDVARLVLTDEEGTYRGFEIRGSLRRHYPLGDFAPWLLGWTSRIASKEEFARLEAERGKGLVSLNMRLGRRGLERHYDLQLQGVPGKRISERDADGQFTIVRKEEHSKPGRPLYLSLDVGVSREAEALMDRLEGKKQEGSYYPGGRHSGAFVLLDAFTGEILVWAETPRFNLNEDLSSLTTPDGLRPVQGDVLARIWEPKGPLDAPIDEDAWRAGLVLPVPIALSRAGQVAVEPGSTLKTLIALGMLSSGLPLPFEAFVCDGGRNPGCHHCGTVDLVGAISRSCNRYFSFSVRDSKNWPQYRGFLGGFGTDLGLGSRPTSECAEWSAGQWLWPWQDFELKLALERAQLLLDEQFAGAGPRLELSVSPRTPATVGGNLDRVARKFADMAGWIHGLTGAKTVELSALQERVEGAHVTLRFGARAPGRAPWFALPGAAVELPPTIARLKAEDRGVSGDAERGGTLWFRATFPRHVGRADASQPISIPADAGRNVAIGQGPVLTTPLQMARAIAVFANGGQLVEPHAVRAIGTRRTHFPARQLPLAREHLELVRRGMWEAVNTPEGTADDPAWAAVPAEVYAKTGTAQVGGTWKPWKTGTEAAEEDSGPWHHWFVGFAEAPGRRSVAFACVLHARTEAAAGLTAAPLTREILERWYASERSNEVGARGAR
ncbi:MAG: penicillin-binding transpeptidase domain-containing protein [Planctomycetota bacterium]|nr:penicillin-binding transpeptidase domain-containing protein [Planctomycetota bacterium]